MLFNLNMGCEGSHWVFFFNWRVLRHSDGSQYYWDGNQGFWKGQIVVLGGPDGGIDLFTVLKGPDRQGGSECPWVVEGS